MGISGLLGLLDGLGDLLGKLFSGLFTFLVNILIVPVVKAAIRVVITVLQYFTATLFYEISKFLLGLIDFVEVLFRALAGLPSTVGADQSISFSINGKSGDLLLQMLTSSEVLQAFYATAIVGFFLLIITTIFQMIKVEYTTEGAQNSKSGIIGKSLKSLCNMLIIPIMCVLGVFIGNQVLDLIDTATGGAEGCKISGTLWVAAASTALVDEGSMVHSLQNVGVKDIEDLNNSGGLLGAGISLALTRGFAAILDPDAAEEPLCTPFSGTQAERERIESQYITGNLSFYNTATVVKNYNPFEVNYLVLIFGACIIIKCLYATCFGLIDRLYQCVALFIVMPMVVGMSPVKDSVGGWRGKFMNKALSAYGTVISLNLFFIIVKILLNINIQFGNFYSTNNWPFPPSFMAGLIKSLMVIVGCLMIEKLSGDLSGYFGGGNAMSEGKDLSSKATAGIKQAATVGMGVATMGAGLIKTGAGIAGKVGSGAYKAINRASGGAIGDAVDGISSGIKKKATVAKDKVSNWAPVRGVKSAVEGAKTWVAETDAGVTTSTKKAQERLEKAKINYEKYQNDITATDQQKAEAKAELDSAQKVVDDNSSKMKAYSKVQEQRADDKLARREKLATTKEGLRKLYDNKFGTQALFNTVAPKSLQGLQKDYKAAYKDANSASAEGQAMVAHLESREKKATEDAYNDRNSNLIMQKNVKQLGLTFDVVGAKLQSASVDTTKELDKLNTTLKDLIDKRNKATDDSAKDAYANRIMAVQERMQGLNAKLQFDDDFKVKNESELKVDFKMDDAFMKKLQAEVKKGVKMDEIMSQISEEFKKMGLNDKDTLAKIYKALEELKSQFGGK